MLTTLFSIFWVFFYIGVFGFGGGYAMISLIQFEVVNDYSWMTSAEFANLLALSQMTPGPISINTATYVGFSVFQTYGYIWAIVGATVATFALCLPSILMMVVVIKFLFKHEDNVYVKAVFSGLRPAVVGLIFSTAAMMMFNFDSIHNYITDFAGEISLSLNKENLGSNMLEHIVSIAICVASFIALFFYKANPMKLIVLSGIAGFIIYYVFGTEIMS